jgi:hypothetical protein
MASYWIVVTRENTELFDLLSVAFRGRRDFSVIVDRRGAARDAERAGKPGRAPALGPDEFVVAERLEPIGHAADSSGEGNRGRTAGVLVRRRRVPPESRRKSPRGSGSGSPRTPAPLAAAR